MTLRSIHTTTYSYSEPVSLCHNEVRVAPRSTSRQHLLRHDLQITPEPENLAHRKDYYGNDVAFFTVIEPHKTLTITGTSVVELQPADAPLPHLSPTWEEVRDHVRLHRNPESLDAFQFLFASDYVKPSPAFAAFAEPSFPARRPILEGVIDLSRRIHTGFKYSPHATTIATPAAEVLEARRGVCQDFSHVMIAALRSLALPARYVSGYLRSNPKVVGAEVSHAWVSAYCPGFGWFDIDPTNNVVPAEGHLTVAWGRDYGDVTPARGVALGGGEHTIKVTVKVLPEISAA
ncbi:MAG: transglutaminase family protein [Bryobacteraceae bacterium]|nr:transglutaminase family protein [Bryobacteraceae bacterium]